MKIKFVFLYILIVFLQANTTIAKPLRIFAVQSYSINHICGYPQLAGFKQRLEQMHIKYEMETYYLYSRTLYTDKYSLQLESDHVISLIKDYNPTVVVLFDDAAFSYIAPKLPDKYIIVFSGINNYYSNYLKQYPILKQKKICGVEEIFSLRKVMPMLNYFDEILVLYGDTITSKYAVNNFIQEYQKLIEQDFLLKNKIRLTLKHISTKRELDNSINYANLSEKNILVVIAVQRVLDTSVDEYFKSIAILKYIQKSIRHSVTFFFNLTVIPEIDMTIGPDFYDMGLVAADMLVSCLQNKSSNTKIVSTITYIYVSRGNLLNHNQQQFLEQYLENFDEIKP